MVDFEVMNQWVTFLKGMVVACIFVYGVMKQQGLTPFPVAKIESGRAKIAAGAETIEKMVVANPLAAKIMDVAGNISPQEIGVILTVAAERANQEGGYTLKDAQDVGQMIIEAAKSK